MRRLQGYIQSKCVKAPIRLSFGWVLALSLLLSAGFSGCSYKNKNVLFKTKTKVKTDGAAVYRINYSGPGSDSLYLHRIQPDDRVAVRFLNNFDITTGVSLAGGGNSDTELGFLVGTDGFARLPLIGPTYLQDCTRASAAQYLEKAYEPHIRNPNIEVSILNLSVSVLGEVEKPGLYVLEKERTNLIEVLAMAQGVGKFGKTKVVKVIRGDLTNPEILVFDLRQIESIATEDLIIHDNDIVYIEPQGIKLLGDAVLPYTSLISALTAIVLVVVTIQQRTQ